MNGQPTGGGWVKLHREILEHRDFQNGEWLKLWVWMLLKATHKPYPYRFNGNPITLQPGQFVTCRKDMAREVRLHESSIQRLIKRMKSEQQIEQLTGNASSLFTITNWNHYQQIEQPIEHPANTQRTPSEQPANHKQEQKNKITEEQKNKDTASADADGPMSLGIGDCESVKPGIKAEDIYAKYPRKEGKPSALRAIAKAMKRTSPEILLERTEAFAAARRSCEMRYCPHPATWYNDERYNDDPSMWTINDNLNAPVQSKHVPESKLGYDKVVIPFFNEATQ